MTIHFLYFTLILGKEPPNIDISSGRILFKYTGDKCNATHNYTINFEMKCDFSMEYEAAVDMDVIYVRNLFVYISLIIIEQTL